MKGRRLKQATDILDFLHKKEKSAFQTFSFSYHPLHCSYHACLVFCFDPLQCGTMGACIGGAQQESKFQVGCALFYTAGLTSLFFFS
jgi:hypothetical protein